MALRRKFSPEFKSEAVRLVTQVGISVNSVANDLGIHDGVLRRWIREAASPSKARQAGSAASRKTRSEVCLRRAARPIRTMCRVMQVSHSGFYDWVERKPSRREQANRILKAHIKDSFHGSDRTYGSPRVWLDLQDWGHACSENRVARLMQQLGLKARAERRRQPGDTGVRPEGGSTWQLSLIFTRAAWW